MPRSKLSFHRVEDLKLFSAWERAWAGRPSAPPPPSKYVWRGDGVFMIADQPLGGMTFPRALVAAEVDRLQRELREGVVHLGEFFRGTHPLTWDGMSRLDDVTHVLEKVELAGLDVMATVRLMPTHPGLRVVEMIEANLPIYGSFRALGSVDMGTVVDFKLLKLDLVSE